MKVFSILSPTWALADFAKTKWDRTKVIEVLNSVYLWVAIASVSAVLVFQEYWAEPTSRSLNSSIPYFFVFAWTYFLLSRCNEIFWAFLRDAFDKMDKTKKSKSDLQPHDRVRLSLKSYLEIVLNFSLLYALLPMTEAVWNNGQFPIQSTDAMYFSGVTITTLGYGDFSPAHWYPQFLTVYEVFCGFILLIVCFAIYSGIGPNNQVNKDASR